MSNQNELVEELIKIANKLDKNGHYESANDVTKIASDLSQVKVSASFFKDLGRTLRQEIQQGLKQRVQQKTRGLFDISKNVSPNEQAITAKLNDLTKQLANVDPLKRYGFIDRIKAAQNEVNRLKGKGTEAEWTLLSYSVNDLSRDIQNS